VKYPPTTKDHTECRLPGLTSKLFSFHTKNYYKNYFTCKLNFREISYSENSTLPLAWLAFQTADRPPTSTCPLATTYNSKYQECVKQKYLKKNWMMLEKYNPRYLIPTAIIAPYIIITCNVSVHITAFIPPCKI
jgi:hypothetical protein